MAKSTVTRKHQTTILKEVREALGLRLGDRLMWEILGDEVRVTAADTAFLRRKGIFKVGLGSVVEKELRAALQNLPSCCHARHASHTLNSRGHIPADLKEKPS